MATTKKNVKTTANTKENTMNNDAKKLTAEERKAAREERYAAHRAAHDEKINALVATGAEPAEFDVVWFINLLEDERKGAKRPTAPVNLTGKWAEHDAQEVVYLRMAAAANGWNDDAYATKTQAERWGGRLKDDAEGWEVQSGDTFWFTAYPYSAFEWDTESGTPEYDEERGAERDLYYAQKRARNLAKKAKAEQKAVEQMKRNIAKPAANNSFRKENDELKAQLKAQADQMAQMQAMLAQLMAAQLKTA